MTEVVTKLSALIEVTGCFIDFYVDKNEANVVRIQRMK